MGVPIEEKKFLFSLNYADDQVIISQYLEFILKRLNKAYKERGLTINLNKTEFIAINKDQEFYIMIREKSQLSNFRTLNNWVLT